MIKVGVTGGIGSGKSTFCKTWEKLGAFVVYADDFAKKLMNEDEELKRKIINSFGAESYQENGELNRAYLAKEAFQKGRVEELNQIVHPLLWKRINELAVTKKEIGVTIFLKEAAILLDKGRPADLDYVILIEADASERAQRVVKRDEVNETEVFERMKAQKSFEDLAPLADFVVLNEGSEEDLKLKAQKLYHHVKSVNRLD